MTTSTLLFPCWLICDPIKFSINFSFHSLNFDAFNLLNKFQYFAVFNMKSLQSNKIKCSLNSPVIRYINLSKMFARMKFIFGNYAKHGKCHILNIRTILNISERIILCYEYASWIWLNLNLSINFLFIFNELIWLSIFVVIFTDEYLITRWALCCFYLIVSRNGK